MTGPGGSRPGAPDGAWGGAGTNLRGTPRRAGSVRAGGDDGPDGSARWLQSDLDRVDRERRERWMREPQRVGDRRERRSDPSAGPLRASRDPLAPGTTRTRAPRPPRAAVRKQSRLGRFVAAYGWRAYAVPVLVAATVLALVDISRGGEAPSPTPTLASSDANPALGPQKPAGVGPTIVGGAPSGDGRFDAAIASGALPDGGAFTATGDGTYRVVPGTTAQVGQGQVATYTVEVEGGVDTTAFGGDDAFARLVDSTLANPKSWAGDPRFAFRRVDSGNPTFRVSLTSQMTVRQDCGYTIELEGSCYNSGLGRVVLNEARWVRGAISYQGDIGSYRQYMVNHEVGHAIGFDHQPCESDGGLAPVMMQQTYGVANDDISALDPQGVVPANGFVCRFNPWPFPRG
ncbi:DUF3152 domain-containing protein [Rhodococcus aerolatus]